MVSQLIFKSFIHLQFIFVYGVSWWLSFIFLHVAVQISNTICWRGYFNSTVYFWTFCQILINHRDLGLFLGSLFCPLIYVSVLMPVPECFDYCGLVLWFDARYCNSSYIFLLLLKIALAIWSHLYFHIHFWNVCSISVKNIIGILIGISMNYKLFWVALTFWWC